MAAVGSGGAAMIDLLFFGVLMPITLALGIWTVRVVITIWDWTGGERR